MIQYRGIAALIIGVWLGAGIFADLAVTQNFTTVDRFLATRPTDPARAAERVLLRRNAGEENNYIFLNWERAEFAIGAALLFVLVAGSRPEQRMLALAAAMVAIVTVQHFYLTPQIAEMGRQEPVSARFWTFHGIYSGIEILKLALGAALAWASQLVSARG